MEFFTEIHCRHKSSTEAASPAGEDASIDAVDEFRRGGEKCSGVAVHTIYLWNYIPYALLRKLSMRCAVDRKLDGGSLYEHRGRGDCKH